MKAIAVIAVVVTLSMSSSSSSISLLYYWSSLLSSHKNHTLPMSVIVLQKKTLRLLMLRGSDSRKTIQKANWVRRLRYVTREDEKKLTTNNLTHLFAFVLIKMTTTLTTQNYYYNPQKNRQVSLLAIPLSVWLLRGKEWMKNHLKTEIMQNCSSKN